MLQSQRLLLRLIASSSHIDISSNWRIWLQCPNTLQMNCSCDSPHIHLPCHPIASFWVFREPSGRDRRQVTAHVKELQRGGVSLLMVKAIALLKPSLLGRGMSATKGGWRKRDLEKVGMPDTSSPMVMMLGNRSCSIWFMIIMYTTASTSVPGPKYSSYPPAPDQVFTVCDKRRKAYCMETSGS